MTAQITQHTPHFSTAPQISVEDMAAIAAGGFHTVINNRLMVKVARSNPAPMPWPKPPRPTDWRTTTSP